METSLEILNFINSYLIRGIFISILLIIFFRAISKSNIDSCYAMQFIKWMILAYSPFYLLYFLLSLLLYQLDDTFFISRISGHYWWAYWLMLSGNMIFPLFLYIKKFGNKIYVLLIVSILMNIGWLTEWIVII